MELVSTSRNYALIDKFSRSSGRVRAVGLLARATFWECIAIPDIRVQCQHLEEIIAKKSALWSSQPLGAAEVGACYLGVSADQQLGIASWVFPWRVLAGSFGNHDAVRLCNALQSRSKIWCLAYDGGRTTRQLLPGDRLCARSSSWLALGAAEKSSDHIGNALELCLGHTGIKRQRQAFLSIALSDRIVVGTIY